MGNLIACPEQMQEWEKEQNHWLFHRQIPPLDCNYSYVDNDYVAVNVYFFFMNSLRQS